MKIEENKDELILIPEYDSDIFLLGKLFNGTGMTVEYELKGIENVHTLVNGKIRKEDLIFLLNAI